MYASTEPCATCAGAICWGHIGRHERWLKQAYDAAG